MIRRTAIKQPTMREGISRSIVVMIGQGAGRNRALPPTSEPMATARSEAGTAVDANTIAICPRASRTTYGLDAPRAFSSAIWEARSARSTP